MTPGCASDSKIDPMTSTCTRGLDVRSSFANDPCPAGKGAQREDRGTHADLIAVQRGGGGGCTRQPGNPQSAKHRLNLWDFFDFPIFFDFLVLQSFWTVGLQSQRSVFQARNSACYFAKAAFQVSADSL